MKKLLSLFLVLLLLLILAIPALAEEMESEGNVETPAESSMENTPPSSEDASDPAPAPEPESEPAPVPKSEPEPEANPAPALPEAPVEDQASVETSPVDLDDPGLLSGPGSLDAPTYDVTETPAGDIIIEEHSYTRTVDILGPPASFDLDDLTMRSALAAIFGEYTPKTQTVSTYYDGQLLDTSTEYVPGLAGADVEWIAGVIVFTVMLYCLMKLLGGVFK